MGTSIPGKRQAAQVIQKLAGKAQDLALEMKDDDLTADDSLTKLLKMLEEKFGSTDLVRSFSAFKDLMQLRWENNTRVEEVDADNGIDGRSIMSVCVCERERERERGEGGLFS